MKRFIKRFAIKTLLFNTLILLSISGFSAKYYVSVNGNNKNNGSIRRPWSSLAFACTKVKTPGDIIHVNAGTYNETLRANLALGVSIEGDGIDVTIINSKYVSTNSNDASILLNSSGHSIGNQTISFLTLSGANLTATRGICINFRDNVSIYDCKIENFHTSGIIFRGSNVAWDVEPTTYSTGNKVYNTTVNNCATRSESESANIKLNGQIGFLIYNCSFTQTFRPTGQNGNILGGEWNKGLKINDNIFFKPDNEGSAHNFFLELWHWQGGGEIYNNTFNGAAKTNIVDVIKSTYEYGLKIYNNKYLVGSIVPFTTYQIQAINLESRSLLDDVYIYDNYMKNVPNGIWVNATVNEGEGYTSAAVSNIYIHHNVMENVGMSDVNTIPIWMNAYGSNQKITFNKIHVNNNTINCSNIIRGLNAIKWSVIGSFSDLFIQNNILTNSTENVINFDAPLIGSSLSNVLINNNLFYNNGFNTIKFNLAVTNKTEQNNLIGNPLFISSTDLHLQSSSPAINNGINIGFPFNGSAPDIGAYETGIESKTIDITKPVISSFTMPSSSTNLTIPISTFNATDNIGVTGYLITRTNITPTSSETSWSSTKPTTYSFSTEGYKTLYAWVKDAAGNVSSSISQSINIYLPVENISTNNIYFLSPSGDDINGNGSISSPWKSINKAWTVVEAGDIIYMKGGTYTYSSPQNLKGKSGTSGKPIKIWAVEGEKPVITPSSSFSSIRGIDIECNFLHLKGLEICNFKQRTGTSFFYGIYAQNSNDVIFELLKVHDNGFGLSIGQDSGNNLILNSDFYYNADPLTSLEGMIPWGGADGITIRSSNPNKINTIRGCRMWWNSDDGIDLYNNDGLIIIENSWSFWNGYIPGTFTTAGDGNGFKLGVTVLDLSTSVKRIIRNNLAFENRKIGFDQNNAKCITHLYNNTSYNNANMGSAARSYNFYSGYAATVAKNNIDYKTSMSALFNTQSEVTNNSFLKNGAVNTAYYVSSSDFLSLDNTGVDGPRQSDGSLPKLNFLKLASTSDLINKGINVGLSYNGIAPDLGAYESNHSTSDVNLNNLSVNPYEINDSLQVEKLTTEIQELQKIVKIDIFPNPCKNNLTVRFDEIPSIGSRIEILNVLGNVIESRNIDNLQELFNLSQKPNGIYIVKTIIDSKEFTRKILVND